MLCPVCETMGTGLLFHLNTQSGLEICNDCGQIIYNLKRVKFLNCNNNESCENIFECQQCTFERLQMLGIVDTSSGCSKRSFELYRSRNSVYNKQTYLNEIKNLRKNEGISEKEANFLWTRTKLETNFLYIINCVKNDILSTNDEVYLQMYFFSFFCLVSGFRPRFGNLNEDEGF